MCPTKRNWSAVSIHEANLLRDGDAELFEAQSESCSLLICSTFVGIPEPIILYLTEARLYCS